MGMSLKYERNVRFVQATPDMRDECAKVFENSTLYDRYFKGTEFLKEMLYDPLDAGHVIAARTASGEIVGVMVYELKGMFGEFPYLALLGVKDGYRKQAIGSRLIDVFQKICEQTGFDKCFICVSHFNPRAKALYQRKGFKPVVLIPDLIREGIDEWVLMKRL